MHLTVEDLLPDAAEIGLTRESIQTAAESRLRAARLFSPESRQYLYININMVGGAYNISVRYNKIVYDPLSDLSYHTPTWQKGLIGTHGGNSGNILSSLSGQLDKFLVEYLRVNEEACEKR